jgi:large subunit ribosomal protein L9
MKTKLILREDHPVLGNTGDVIEVASGYARNHLLPSGMAYAWSEDAVRRIEKKRREAEVLRAELRKDMEALAKRLEGVSLTFEEKVSGEGHLYGAVTSKRIADALGEQGLETAENNVRLPEPIRAVGEYEVPIHVHAEINASVKVWVVGEEVPEPETPDEESDEGEGDVEEPQEPQEA